MGFDAATSSAIQTTPWPSLVTRELLPDLGEESELRRFLDLIHRAHAFRPGSEQGSKLLGGIFQVFAIEPKHLAEQRARGLTMNIQLSRLPRAVTRLAHLSPQQFGPPPRDRVQVAGTLQESG